MIALAQDPNTLLLMGVFLFSLFGVALIAIWLIKNRNLSKKRDRISQFVAAPMDDSRVLLQQDLNKQSSQEIGKIRDWVNTTLGSLSSEKLQLKLSSAYWKVTDTEYILIRYSVTIFAFLLGWAIPQNMLGGIFLAVIAYMTPPIVMDRAISSRQRKFHNQLLDVLTLIKGSVQAGYSLMQSLDLAVNEVPVPASEEFGRVIYEINLGLSLEDALFNLAERMDNDDLQIVVTAIIINSQVGGNLSTVLEATVSTIRDRLQLQGEVRSLTSYARYVGNFLSLLPFIMGVAIFMLNPDYFEPVKTSIITQIIFILALMGVFLGNLWIRKIVKIKV